MTPTQLEKLLRIAIPAKRPILIGGLPGIGKTSIAIQVAKELKNRVVVTNLSTADTTRSSGLPWLSAKAEFAEFKPYGDLQEILTADPDEPITWLWEEVGNASHSVQASFRPWLLDRALNGRKLGKNVTIIGTTNDRSHKAGSNGIIEPVKSGFHSLVVLEASVKDSQLWAQTHGIHPDVIFFWSVFPGSLNSETVSLGFDVNVNPRGWEHVSDFTYGFESAKIPDIDPVVCATHAGSVGLGVAVDYLDFRNNREAILNLDLVIKDPEGVAIPKEIGKLFAVCAGLARRVEKKTWKAIARFSERMALAGFEEHAVLLFKDAVRRKPELEETETTQRLRTESCMKEALQGSVN